MGFFLAVFAWTIVWLGWNTLAPRVIVTSDTEIAGIGDVENQSV
jgi:hypothetical protein